MTNQEFIFEKDFLVYWQRDS